MRRTVLNKLIRFFKDIERTEHVGITDIAFESEYLPDGSIQVRADCILDSECHGKTTKPAKKQEANNDV